MFLADYLVKVIRISFVVQASLTVLTLCIPVMIKMVNGISFTKLALAVFRQDLLVTGLMVTPCGQALRTYLTNSLRLISRSALKLMSQLRTQAVLAITEVVTAFAWVTDSLKMGKSQFMMTVG